MTDTFADHADAMPNRRRFVVTRHTLTALLSFVLALIYINAMFFKIAGLFQVCYLAIVLLCGMLLMANNKRSILLYFAAAVMLFANENLMLAMIIFLAVYSRGRADTALDNDRDIHWVLILSILAIGFNILTQGIKFDPNLGFVGRLEIGFVHPNLFATWAILVTYYCLHYTRRLFHIPALLFLTLVVLLTGSLGKLPILGFLFFHKFLFRYRQIVFYSTVLLIIVGSVLYLTAYTYTVTIVSSGRNLIFLNLLDVMGWKVLYATANQSVLIHAHELVAFFGDDYTVNMPFDSVVSAATALGILPTLVLGLMTGAFKCPENRRDFDRKMLFWLFGFASNPISIWTPYLIFLIKASDTESPAETHLRR
jgi:hypothetical protein